MASNIKIAILLTAMDKASAVIDRSISKVEKRMGKLQKVSQNIDNLSNKALIAGGIGTAFFGLSINAAEESEVATNRLSQVFKSMGQDYVAATKQSADYASNLQVQIGKEDELIMAVQAKVATFSKAANAQARANGIFNRATTAAFDLEAAGFGEASQSAVQLGKALQDPVKGLNALRRSGISFTEAEQKKIKALVASGKLFEAQDTIMKAIEKQVGGVAASTVTKTAKMKIAWGEIQEKIGTIILPLFNKLADTILNRVIPQVQGFIDKHPQLVMWLAKASVALLALGAAGKAIGFILSGMAPIVINVARAIGFVSKAVMFLGRAMLANPILLIIAAIALAVYLIIKHWKVIKAFFIRLWNGVKSVFASVIKGIKFYLLNFTPPGLIYKYWGTLSKWFSNIWNAVKNIFSGAVSFVVNLGSSFWNAGKNIITSLWEGMKSVVMKPVNLVKDMAHKIRRYLPFSPAKEGALKDIHKIKLVETIAATITPRPLISAMDKTMGQLAGYSRAKPVPARAGGGISLTSNVTVNGNANKEDLKSYMDVRDRDLLKQLERAQGRKDALKFS